jgi:formylglycine-generating enzyme required for sulfatase activity
MKKIWWFAIFLLFFTGCASRNDSIDGMKHVGIPAGEFTMGSNDGRDNEKPVHTVYVDAFLIDKTEVTNAMFRRFVEATGYETLAEKVGESSVYFLDNRDRLEDADWQHLLGPDIDMENMDDYPVVHVSWDDAVAYCEWAGGRLPTEAEWEKAARGTDARSYPWGNESPTAKLGNFSDINLKEAWAIADINDGYLYSAPVGSYPAGASPYGVLDMAGNVLEWVQDWKIDTYYQESPANNPLATNSGNWHVLRGGSWYSKIEDIKSAARGAGNLDLTIDYVGFRCAHPQP